MNSNNRKKIGIVGYVTGNAFGVGLSYMQYFSNLGDVTIINHTETEARKDLDLLVIPGGPDVDTTRYLKPDEKIHILVGKPCPFRERFDAVLLPQYIANGTPIFGICRGHQTLAVHFGGTLHQDMWHETNGENRSSKVHEIKINNDLLVKHTGYYISDSSGKKRLDKIRVNSIHHQAVKDIPKNAVEIAVYAKGNRDQGQDVTNEALIYTDHKIASVQYHPEEINDILAEVLINYLLS